jgi:hypothetical protein
MANARHAHVADGVDRVLVPQIFAERGQCFLLAAGRVVLIPGVTLQFVRQAFLLLI